MNVICFHRLFTACFILCFVPQLLSTAVAVDKLPIPQEQSALEVNADAILQPWKGDWQGMLDRRVIRVLTTYNKTFYFLDKGTQRGLTYDAFMAFEKDLNRRLVKDKKLSRHLKVHVIFVPVSRDKLFTALNEGRGDIAAANLSITPTREKLAAFTVPLYTNVKELLLSGPHSPKVETLEQLSGKTVFVRFSSSYYESLQALNARFSRESLPLIKLEAAPEALEDEDLIEMLNAGLIPLIVVDRHKALFWKQVFPKITVHEEVVLRDGADIAWAVRKDSPQLLALLNGFVKHNSKGSKFGNILLTRYLKNVKYVKNAAADKERRKLLAMVDVFRKYAGQYDVDWLLMIAQGYQESRLDQSARSKSGAIGVMQVLPSTGKELNVGDIRKLDPNINAGVKYMRWMIDHYYSDEPMTPLDKALFSFASYNAGPARIARLRIETHKRGFDPNVWFGNVENLAAEKIGSETVTYVSNIYKYYIAYQLIMKERGLQQKVREKSMGQPVPEKAKVAE